MNLEMIEFIILLQNNKYIVFNENMLNPPIKTCKTCDKTPMKGRRFCLSCIREQEKEKAKEKKKLGKVKVRKEKAVDKKRFSKTSLVKEADRVFSLYIRARDKGKPCITC